MEDSKRSIGGTVEETLASHLEEPTEIEEKYVDIYSLIKAIDREIGKNDIGKARALYNDLKKKYSQVEADEHDKQALYNEILRVHADIHLAMIQ